MPRAGPKGTKAAFDALPLFASDRDIAVALVGEAMAPTIMDMMPVLERMGFPAPDPLFIGRYVPAVRRWLDHRYGLASAAPQPPDGGIESERWDLLDRKTGRMKKAAPLSRGAAGNARERPNVRRPGPGSPEG